MKMVQRHVFGQFIPEMGPATGHIDGVPTNTSVTVFVWEKKDGFHWTLDRGNARRKNLRGPFPNLQGALDDAKEKLKGI